MEIVIAETYKVGKKVGAGSFGEIYLGKSHNLETWLLNISFNSGKNIVTNEEVAIKRVSL